MYGSIDMLKMQRDIGVSFPPVYADGQEANGAEVCLFRQKYRSKKKFCRAGVAAWTKIFTACAIHGKWKMISAVGG